jgi:RecT family
MRPIIPGTDLTPIVSLPALYNPRDLALIRRTVANDTTDDEFALFIHWARSLRLDPLRRQVHAFVFHKHDPKKRRLSLVTYIEGVRAIAARAGNYRPTKTSLPSLPTTLSKPRPIRPASSAAPSGSGNTRTVPHHGRRPERFRMGASSQGLRPMPMTFRLRPVLRNEMLRTVVEVGPLLSGKVSVKVLALEARTRSAEITLRAPLPRPSGLSICSSGASFRPGAAIPRARRSQSTP